MNTKLTLAVLVMSLLMGTKAFAHAPWAPPLMPPAPITGADDLDAYDPLMGEELTPDQIAEDMGWPTEQQMDMDEDLYYNWLGLDGMLTLAGSYQVRIDVDISKQRLSLSSPSGDFSTIVSTAGGRYHTKQGCFNPGTMETMHYSRKYNNSPMPYSIFYYGGYALHGHEGGFDGRGHSHGCVRVPTPTMKKIYGIVKKYRNSTRICIHD